MDRAAKSRENVAKKQEMENKDRTAQNVKLKEHVLDLEAWIRNQAKEL